MRHQSFHILKSHSLFDGTLHPNKPHPILVFDKLPYGAYTSVAEMIDIINSALRVFQTNKISYRMDNIISRQRTILNIDIESKFSIYFISTNL